MALKEDFDLIILDLMLPGVDGFEICRQIRDQKNTPIIMVSAKKDDIDKIRGLGLGADDYIEKLQDSPSNPTQWVGTGGRLPIGKAVTHTYQLSVSWNGVDYEKYLDEIDRVLLIIEAKQVQPQ